MHRSPRPAKPRCITIWWWWAWNRGCGTEPSVFRLRQWHGDRQAHRVDLVRGQLWEIFYCWWKGDITTAHGPMPLTRAVCFAVFSVVLMTDPRPVIGAYLTSGNWIVWLISVRLAYDYRQTVPFIVRLGRAIIGHLPLTQIIPTTHGRWISTTATMTTMISWMISTTYGAFATDRDYWVI